VAYALSDEIKKTSTLDNLKGQYCNRNCLGCNSSSLATAGFSCFTYKCWLRTYLQRNCKYAATLKLCEILITSEDQRVVYPCLTV